MARVIDCPKCGVSQPEDVFCANCGVKIKSFVAQSRSSKTKESAIISIVGVLLLGLGIYFVQKTVRKTFNMVVPGEEIEVENENQPGPSAVTQQGYRRSSEDVTDASTGSTASAESESVPTTAETTTAAVVPLGSVRVKIQKISAEQIQAFGGTPGSSLEPQLQIVKTAQAPQGAGQFEVNASQGWPIRVEEPLTVQAANAPMTAAATAPGAATQDPDGLFLRVSRVEGNPNAITLDGDIKISTIMASGPIRIALNREIQIAGDETAIIYGFMPREALKPNLRLDSASPFSVLQDQAFLAQASDLAIYLEGTEPTPAAP